MRGLDRCYEMPPEIAENYGDRCCVHPSGDALVCCWCGVLHEPDVDEDRGIEHGPELPDPNAWRRKRRLGP